MVEKSNLPPEDLNSCKWYRNFWNWTPERLRKVLCYRKTEDRLSELAMNRRLMGYFRYNRAVCAIPRKPEGRSWDFMGRLKDKYDRYMETGNKEMLVDMYNYLIFEWYSPSKENTHFTPEDQENTGGTGLTNYRKTDK